MQPGSDPRNWQDLCHVFVTNHIEFERRWALQQPLERDAERMPVPTLRREWRRLREQQLAAYLKERIDADGAYGQASALLGLLSVSCWQAPQIDVDQRKRESHYCVRYKNM